MDAASYGVAVFAVLASGYILCTISLIGWNHYQGYSLAERGLTYLLIYNRFGYAIGTVLKILLFVSLASGVSFGLTSRRAGSRVARAARRVAMLGIVLQLLTVAALILMFFVRGPIL